MRSGACAPVAQSGCLQSEKAGDRLPRNNLAAAVTVTGGWRQAHHFKNTMFSQARQSGNKFHSAVTG